MKLFLASSFDKVARLFEQKLKESLENKKVIFVANPADPYEGDRLWVRADRDAYVGLGCEVIDTDLRSVSIEKFQALLEDGDILHICGGSVLYTILLLREKGFDSLIANFIKENKIVYSGTSAGSIIVSGDLSLIAVDPEEKAFVGTTKDYSGLGLVDFFIMPHANNGDFSDGNVEMVKLLPKYSKPLIFLHDSQAIWVSDDTLEIVAV